MRTYALLPTDNRKSFYNKALVRVAEDGAETLYSYGTKIISKNTDGKLTKHWNGYSATTQRHIKAFCGLNKAEYLALPLEQ